jgi:hypothetical protein
MVTSVAEAGRDKDLRGRRPQDPLQKRESSKPHKSLFNFQHQILHALVVVGHVTIVQLTVFRFCVVSIMCKIERTSQLIYVL